MSSKQQHKMHSNSTQHTSQHPREMKLLIQPLRNASTPLSSPLPPSPPANPCPWLWRCHSCYTIYRLAVTRRCLDCDHTFCLGEPATAAGQPRGKKRKRGGPCKAEFDYTGWKARGAWRRTVLLNGDINNKPAVSTNTAAARQSQQKWGNEHRAATESLGDEARFEEKRERLFIRRRHNCFLHCDFPSECHHSLFRAQQEGRPILREAEALDAAEAEERERAKGHGEGKRRSRRLTVQEYKQRQAERRRKSVSGAATAPVAGRFVEDLSTVTEEETEEDYEEGDTISPCSPTSPDPTGDLMREVSPVENGDDDNEQPLSPSGRSRRERASLLVTTDTPVDFATTAAPLSFEDTYSDDEDEELGEHGGERRTKSRRKAAQPTDEHPESLGPFILDTSAPSPASPLSAAATNNNIRAGKAGRSHNPTALDLQAAWSEQAWFSSGSSSASEQHHPRSPKSPERVGTRDRMFALLGRRGSASPTSPGLSHDGFVVPLARVESHSQQQHQPHHADATAVAVAGEEEWESWSDSSTSSSTSSSSSGTSLLSSSSAEHGALASTTMDITDADGDVPMPDFTAPPRSKGVDNDMDSTTPPTGRQRAGARGGDGTEEDLRALLRMRNAFMRGEML